MIALSTHKDLTDVERFQFDQILLAKGAWKEGRPDDAVLIMQSLLAEELTPRVSAKCYTSLAAFYAEAGKMDESWQMLQKAALVIDYGDDRDRASFHNQRGRYYKENGQFDSASINYSGAAASWELLGDKEMQGGSLLNSAGACLALGDTSKAQTYLDQAIPLLKEARSADVLQAYETQSRTYLAEGKLELASSFIVKAIELNQNELWEVDFLKTRDAIEEKLLELLGVQRVSDLEDVKVGMVRRALIKSDGSLTHAGIMLGLKHKSVDWIIRQHPELEPLRIERRTNSVPFRKSIIKTPK